MKNHLVYKNRKREYIFNKNKKIYFIFFLKLTFLIKIFYTHEYRSKYHIFLPPASILRKKKHFKTNRVLCSLFFNIYFYVFVILRAYFHKNGKLSNTKNFTSLNFYYDVESFNETVSYSFS